MSTTKSTTSVMSFVKSFAKPETSEKFDSAVRGASAKQIETYLNLCSRKNIEPKSFSSSKEYSDEISLLITLPDWQPISEGQFNAIIKYCSELELNTPLDLLSFSKTQASDYINDLMEKLPMTEGQQRTLLDLYRFKLIDISLDEVAQLNRSSASNLISEHSAKLAPSAGQIPINWGKATVGQWSKCCELLGSELDIITFSEMSRTDADAYIKSLSQKVSAVANSHDEEIVVGKTTTRKEKKDETQPSVALYLHLVKELNIDINDTDFVYEKGIRTVEKSTLIELAKELIDNNTMSIDEINAIANNSIGEDLI